MMKKKLIAGLMTMAMTAAVTAAAVLPVKAAAPSGVKIEGRKTVHTGRTIELDAEIYPDDDDVRDRNIIWKSSKPSVAKVLDKRGDSTKIKGKKAGTAKITVRIKGTKLKAVYKIKVKQAAKSTSTNSDEKKLQKYKKQIKAIKQEMAKTVPAASAQARKSQFISFEKRLNSIDRKLDNLNDKWDDRDGRTARKMENAIERVEDYLEDVEDYLEDKFDVDDWDDNDPDDRDDDEPDDWNDDWDD